MKLNLFNKFNLTELIDYETNSLPNGFRTTRHRIYVFYNLHVSGKNKQI